MTDAPKLDHGYVLREAHELYRFYATDDSKPYTCGVIADCIATIENLQERNERLTERCEAYKGQVKAGSDEIASLKARIEQTEGALRAIMKATVEGRVCDDVAWFDSITTLHDFCDLVLNGPGEVQP